MASNSTSSSGSGIVEVDHTLDFSRKKVQEAREDKTGRVYRVYADGVFDLFHVGHALMLKQAKHLLGNPSKTYLIAGVCSDELTQKYKGKTILDHKTRCLSVEQCKWVDEVVAEAPWEITPEFLEQHKIDFVAHDSIPYVSNGSKDVYSFVKDKGMFLETQRTEGISTSDILLRIVCDYDSYVMRNVKRGYTPEQLNLGPVMRMKVTEQCKREEVGQALTKTKNEFQGVTDAALAFVHLFNPRINIRFGLSPNHLSFKDVEKQTKGVWKSLKSLFTAIGVDLSLVASYLNVFSYLPPSARKYAYVSAVILISSGLVRKFIIH